MPTTKIYSARAFMALYCHLMVSVVHEQVATLQDACRAILVVHLEALLCILAVLPNLVNRRVPADDGLVVRGPRETLRDSQRTASVVDRHLVAYRRGTFFASVRSGLVVGTSTPRDVRDIGRSHRPRKPQLIVLPHDVIQLSVLFRREVDVFVVHLRCEVLAELVECRLNCGGAHPRHLVDACEAVAPPEDGETRQHLAEPQEKESSRSAPGPAMVVHV